MATKPKKPKPKKNAFAQGLVAMRHKKLSPARRKEIATAAATKRWGAKKASKKAADSPPFD